MSKYIYDFDKWCKRATKGIKYRPDRQTVYGELYHHLEDRYQGFIDQNMEHEAAVQKALHVMGDTAEIAPMLAAIHRPFWGYMYSLCKWGFFLALLIMASRFVPWLNDLKIINYVTYNAAYNGIYDVYTETYYEDDYSTWERTLYKEPYVSAASDGYTFTVTKVALWHETLKNPPASPTIDADEDKLWIEIEISNPRPWISLVEYNAYNALYWFWAEDSLGNYYYSANEYYYTDVPTLVGNCYRSGIFTHTYSMYTWNYVSKDAEWIDLHYDRSGRDIVLRIDLTGGEDHEKN